MNKDQRIKNGIITQILVDLDCLKNKMILQDVERSILVFLKISRTSGCTNGDQRSRKWDDSAEY